MRWRTLRLVTTALLASIVTATGSSLNSVAALPASNSTYTGFLFAYFTGEDLPGGGGESISFAVSTGPEPTDWHELNRGRPVLRSQLGTKGVRDPTIIRSRDGRKFYLLATDLKIEGAKGGDVWGQATSKGSRALVVWESSDLRKWGTPRLVMVSLPEAGCTWAPEAAWDPERRKYMVFWSSRIYPSTDREHRTKGLPLRVMRAWTSDFVTFSRPEDWISYPDKPVIDTCMVRDPGTGRYFRFTKDERIKFIMQENGGRTIDGPWELVKSEIGKGPLKRAEGPLVFASITTPGKWHMFLDEFLVRGYMPFETTDIAAADWTLATGYKLPKRTRHGTVIPITKEEQRALLAA